MRNRRAGTKLATEARFSETELMLRSKRPAIRSDRFPFFVLDDFVSPELYERLVQEFPTHEEMAAKHQHGKLFINNRQLDDTGDKDRFFSKKPAWREVVRILGSQAFMDDLESLLRPYLLRHRLFGALRKWKAGHASIPPFDRSVQRTCEWSCMPKGAYLNPHTDKVAKLATFVWHFPEPDWRETDRGGTVFMSAKRARHNFNWANFKLPFDELDVIEESEVRPNRLVMFAKTGNSWHGVKPIECAAGTYRRVFIFNYRYPVEDANGFVARAFESVHRRSQGFLFKDFPDVNSKPAL